jgi:hypothetical protein
MIPVECNSFSPLPKSLKANSQQYIKWHKTILGKKELN